MGLNLSTYTHSARAEIRAGLKFACVGLLGTVVNTAALWLLTDGTHLYYLLSSAVATELAILHNFTINNLWTFTGAHGGGTLLTRLLKFNTAALGGLLLTVGVLFMLVHYLSLNYLIANVLAIGASTLWNYSASRLWVWKEAAR